MLGSAVKNSSLDLYVLALYLVVNGVVCNLGSDISLPIQVTVLIMALPIFLCQFICRYVSTKSARAFFYSSCLYALVSSAFSFYLYFNTSDPLVFMWLPLIGIVSFCVFFTVAMGLKVYEKWRGEGRCVF